MRKGWSKKAEVLIYRGHRYRRYPNGSKAHRRYFSASPPRSGLLHRHVWEDEKGPIPSGYEVHHKDEDTLNNDISNLECLTVLEHRNKHPMVGETLERQRQHMVRIGKLASQWHKTEEGREAARKAAYASWGPNRETYKKICAGCKVEYEGFFERGRFCSRVCRRKYKQ